MQKDDEMNVNEIQKVLDEADNVQISVDKNDNITNIVKTSSAANIAASICELLVVVVIVAGIVWGCSS